MRIDLDLKGNRKELQPPLKKRTQRDKISLPTKKWPGSCGSEMDGRSFRWPPHKHRRDQEETIMEGKERERERERKENEVFLHVKKAWKLTAAAATLAGFVDAD